jgi:hypothetical protein
MGPDIGLYRTDNRDMAAAENALDTDRADNILTVERRDIESSHCTVKNTGGTDCLAG